MVAGAGKKTGAFAGLANQGATCYMNSLLQLFFTVPAVRRGVLAAVPLPPEPATWRVCTASSPGGERAPLLRAVAVAVPR